MMGFEKKEGKKRRRLAGWRLAREDTEEDRFAEDGVERPVVSELFWKVSIRLSRISIFAEFTLAF